MHPFLQQASNLNSVQFDWPLEDTGKWFYMMTPFENTWLPNVHRL
jgi:hypothetical protein